MVAEALNGDAILVDGDQGIVHLRPEETVAPRLPRQDRHQAEAQKRYASLRNLPVGSHAAIVARALAIPLVINASRVVAEALNGDAILVDGDQGIVHLRPEETVAHAGRQPGLGARVKPFQLARDLQRQFPRRGNRQRARRPDRSSEPRSIWSRNRPGVPTTICAPRSSARRSVR
nr:PEP-utilizing enzyme [Mycobacterium tuberculosis]